MAKSFFLILVLLAELNALAQPVPKLNSLSPQWVQRGSAVDITFTGENLDGVTGFVFGSDAGMTAQLFTNGTETAKVESSAGGLKPLESGTGRPTVRVRVAGDAALGTREVRVITPLGVSNPLPLHIGTLPEVVGGAKNNSPEQAQRVELPAAITGVIKTATESDYYRFHARKGERLVFEVDAAKHGSKLDSTLVLLDVAGRELARNEDYHGPDSLLVFPAPDEADYVLQIRDMRFQGGADFTYHLRAGAIPRVDYAFPFGGRRGETVEIALFGPNIAPGETMKFKIAPEAPLGPQEIRAHLPGGVSNPLQFEVSDLPEFVEPASVSLLPKTEAGPMVKPEARPAPAGAKPDKKTKASEKATRPEIMKVSVTNSVAKTTNVVSTTDSVTGPMPVQVTVPVVINGRLGQPKEVDEFTFTVEKGETLICEVMAGRFGSPLDALLILKNAKGNVLQQNDGAGGADARLQFRAEEAGNYTLAIRDLTDRGGENFVYRLAVHPLPKARPDFDVVFFPDTPRVLRGASTTVRAEVIRKAGFAGDVEVYGENLPPGVTCKPLVLSPALTGGLLEISASESAALGNTPLKIAARASINGRPVTQEGDPIIPGATPAAARRPRRNAVTAGDRAVEDAWLTVLEAAPFKVELLTFAPTLEQNLSTTVEVFTTRAPGFTNAIQVSLEGFSSGRDPITKSIEGVGPQTLKGNQALARFSLRAKIDAELGAREIAARATATVNGQPVGISSHTVPLTVTPLRETEFPFTLAVSVPKLTVTALPAGTKSEANTAAFAVRAARRGVFTEEVALAFEKMPEGVTVKSEAIPRNGGEANITIVATDQAKPSTNNVAIVGTASANGRTFQQRASINVVVNAPAEMAEPVAAKQAAK